MEAGQPSWHISINERRGNADQFGTWSAPSLMFIERVLAEQVDVINRGYSGYNTRWAKYLLETVFPADQPKVKLVTLFWGANDAALPDRHRCALTDIYAFFGTFKFGTSTRHPHNTNCVHRACQRE